MSLGSLLSRSGSIYRDAGAGKGLVVVSSDPSVRPRHVTEGKELTALLIDRVRVQVKKKGKNKGGLIGTRHLALMLETEAFLGEFRSLDDVCRTPRYGTNFELTRPGYNDGGPGQRLLYTGPPAAVEYSLDTIKRFLGVMEFDSNADRTNALGAALTIMLRSCWPGGKPVIIVTSTKSHGGKDTILEFACGSTPSTSISYQHANWALENCLVMALKGNPEIGVIKVDNARPEGGEELASAFLERLVMDKDPWFCSPGTGKGFRITNSLVIGLSTNHGSVSQDLMNRSLPIHLSPVGNVGDRNSPIGNPKDHYLPANRDRIDAELRGMIEKWKREGKPLDDSVKHPFTEWSRTVGGILLVNGYSDFLGNYGLRRTADDPIRHALGLLGVVSPNKWKRPRDWARIAVEQSLVKILINWAERDTETGRERRMGVVLSAHMDETFTVETDDGPVTLRLKKHRGRFNNDAEPSTRYCFEEIAGALPPGSGETRSQRSSNAQKDSKAELKARLEEKKRLLEE